MFYKKEWEIKTRETFSHTLFSGYIQRAKVEVLPDAAHKKEANLEGQDHS